MKIEIEEILKIKERLREINSIDLNKIEFTEGGKVIDINPKYIEEFRFIGLNNSDFIYTEFYKNGFDDDTENLD